MSAFAAFSEVNCARPGYSAGYLSSDRCDRTATNYNENDMAYFSGLGPTSDGRNKPDVMSVGWQVCCVSWLLATFQYDIL